MLWALGQAVTNGYIMYKATCQAAGVQPMSHLKFQVAVAEAWCKTLKPDKAAAAKPVASAPEKTEKTEKTKKTDKG